MCFEAFQNIYRMNMVRKQKPCRFHSKGQGEYLNQPKIFTAKP